jgi:sulfide:quinone oxidoreductase
MSIRRDRVLVAGGGIAGVEAVMALSDLGERQLELELISPGERFVVRALSVGEPFGGADAPGYALGAICAHFGARFVRDRVDRVDPYRCRVRTAAGADHEYDALVLATGALPQDPWPGVLTFHGPQDAPAVRALLSAAASGRVSQVAFVVPAGVSWPLPVYELALMTARAGGVESVHLVTPERAPLALFGPKAGEAVHTLLGAAGIEVHLEVAADVADRGRCVRLATGDLVVDRVVTLPRLAGPRLGGLPSDEAGFLPVDDHARVRGVEHVYAAGDGADYLVKQGGIATQMAGAAAHHIAWSAGAPVDPEPFQPVLRGRLMTGNGDAFLRKDARGHSDASAEALWWPPAKVNGRYLAPWLARWEQTREMTRPPAGGIDVDVKLPRNLDPAVLGLDPYDPS